MAKHTHRNIKMPEVAFRKCERHKKGKGLGQTSLVEKLTALGNMRNTSFDSARGDKCFREKKCMRLFEVEVQLWGKAFVAEKGSEGLGQLGLGRVHDSEPKAETSHRCHTSHMLYT
jgi:hypothetical protein